MKDVIALATLNAAIRETLPYLSHARLRSLQGQTDFLAACLNAWLRASGRKEPDTADELDPANVAYQGRVLSSVLTLVPACIWRLRKSEIALLADDAEGSLTTWFRQILKNAGLTKKRKFLSKADFIRKGFLGSGGIARFRDTLWAAALGRKVSNLHPQSRSDLAKDNRKSIDVDLTT
jgi:hypothetical protein